MIEPISIELPAGVFAAPTKTSKSANWLETNLVRWVNGKLSPIGGWSKASYPPTASPIMAVHRWSLNNGTRVIAYLCEAHVYVDVGGELTDISPVAPLVAPSTGYVAGGYGDFGYGVGSYGTPRPDKQARFVIPKCYTLDNWGQNLLVMTSTDGRLLEWDASSMANKCEAVENAPISNRTFVVSPYRHVILFGMGGVPGDYGWCDEEDNTNWDFATVSSKAGKNNIQPASGVVSVSKSGSEVIVFTEDNVGHVLNYIGLPFIFSMDVINVESAPLSVDSIIDTPGGCVWASSDGFWQYSAGSAVPLPSSVWTWIKDRMDKDVARFKASFVTVPDFSELYFFFPAFGETTNSHYVSWNYKENWWSTGKMRRTCGAKSSFTGYPIMSDGTDVYIHEYGDVYALQPGEELPWAKTHNINFSGGASMLTVGRMLPDIGDDTTGLEFILDYSLFRSGQKVEMTSGPKEFSRGIVGFRDTGRDFQMTVRQNVNEVLDWTMGNNMIEVVRRGRL